MQCTSFVSSASDDVIVIDSDVVTFNPRTDTNLGIEAVDSNHLTAVPSSAAIDNSFFDGFMYESDEDSELSEEVCISEADLVRMFCTSVFVPVWTLLTFGGTLGKSYNYCSIWWLREGYAVEPLYCLSNLTHVIFGRFVL